MTNKDEFEAAMYNAGHAYTDLRKQLERVGTAISNEEPFKLMVELAELNKLVRDTMEHALTAQQHKIHDHVIEMQRTA